MFNPDKFKEQKDQYLNSMADAIRSQDEEQIKAACESWQNFMAEEFKASFDEYSQTADKSILAARGIRQLTKEETDFYNKLAESVKAEGVITGITEALPKTVIDDVLANIKKDHPLLKHINFKNTAAITKWIINAKGVQKATWDELNTAITTKLEGAIEVFEMDTCKLSAYMFCTQDMLAMGPSWVDAYVRATLTEAIAVGLEYGIVDGTGKKEPIGMTRDFTNTYSTSTGFPRKTATVVKDLGIGTYSTVLSKLAFTGERKDNKKGSLSTNPANGVSRPVERVILIVNPVDYFSKVMPATTQLVNGGYVHNIFPFPTDVVQSTAVPANHAIMGIAKNYFMGIGTPTPTAGKLEYDDSVKFLEDLRAYKSKLYGNGRPLDMTSFEYLDITDVKPVIPAVVIDGVVKTQEQGG